jgi:hypothetical protein
MLSKNPAKLVVSGKPLLIDGLDEALTRHEGDAVDEILVSRIRAFETESV